MAFKFQCPKCQGMDYNIARDRKSFAPTRSFELIFSCRCGKQLFGEQIEAEYDRQLKAYEATMARGAMDDDRVERVRAERERKESLRRAMLYQRHHREERLRREQVIERGGEDPNNWREAEAGVTVEDEWLPSEHPECCAWDPCNKRRRANSKYCSRNCSNKNARARHKARSGKGDEKSAGKADAANG